jgi:hypothetical protein
MNTKAKTAGLTPANQEKQSGSVAKWAAKIEDQYIPAPERRVKVSVLKVQGNIPTAKVLVRDLGGQHDVALQDNQVIDLAEGNVLYAVDACDAPKATGCHADPKLAFFVDDRPEETLRMDQTGQTLRELFGFTPDVLLFRDYESPNDQQIGLADSVKFEDGCVFYTRRHSHTINITINGEPYVLHEHKVAVKQLKQMAGIPLADQLEQVVDEKLVPLDDDGTVEVKCGDVFHSHPRDNASS